MQGDLGEITGGVDVSEKKGSGGFSGDDTDGNASTVAGVIVKGVALYLIILMVRSLIL